MALNTPNPVIEYASPIPSPTGSLLITDLHHLQLFEFTSECQVKALPGMVVNGTTPAPGQPGAIGHYKFGLNADLNTICYVRLPDLFSLALTFSN